MGIFSHNLRNLLKSFHHLLTTNNEKTESKLREIENEINLQKRCEHAYVLKLYDQFLSSKFVYHVSESCAFFVDEICNKNEYPVMPIDFAIS